tara:strand:- start:209 stop:814 length:606 start_codon:yes stop_codon:yes gene_type:complete
MSDTNIFNEKGCFLVKQFLDQEAVDIFSKYLEYKIKREEIIPIPADEEIDPLKVPSRLYYYADPLTEVFLTAKQESVERVVGEKLLPTYSYVRVYQPGESLLPHVDRESCEVSVTVNIAFKGENSPIYMHYKQNDPEKYTLNPGEAVIYKGCEALHWRQPLQEDQLVVQFMLHYVRENGLNKRFVKDTRPNFGMSSKTRSL